MGSCYSCGAPVSGLSYAFTCPACTGTALLRDIRGDLDGQEKAMRLIAERCSNVATAVESGFSRFTDELSTLCGVVQGGFDELNWQLEQHTHLLRGIDRTLKTPSQTQAREWREMAEELRARGCFDEAQQWFLKSIEMNPLDFRTYVGLGLNYLRKNDFDEAEKVLARSFPHAPKGELIRRRREAHNIRFMGGREEDDVLPLFDEDEDAYDITDALYPVLDEHEVMGDQQASTQQVTVFDYKSLSHRLIGRIWSCRDDYPRAVAELRKAIELSPDYTEGHYDYAVFSVQAGKTDHWATSLRLVVAAQPRYHAVAMAERRFSPVRPQLTTFLASLLGEARSRSAPLLQEAETKLAATATEIAMSNVLKVQSEGATVNAIAAELAEARSNAMSGDYVSVVKSEPAARRVLSRVESLAKKAQDLSNVFLAEKERERTTRLGTFTVVYYLYLLPTLALTSVALIKDGVSGLDWSALLFVIPLLNWLGAVLILLGSTGSSGILTSLLVVWALVGGVVRLLMTNVAKKEDRVTARQEALNPLRRR